MACAPSFHLSFLPSMFGSTDTLHLSFLPSMFGSTDTLLLFTAELTGPWLLASLHILYARDQHLKGSSRVWTCQYDYCTLTDQQEGKEIQGKSNFAACSCYASGGNLPGGSVLFLMLKCSNLPGWFLCPNIIMPISHKYWPLQNLILKRGQKSCDCNLQKLRFWWEMFKTIPMILLDFVLPIDCKTWLKIWPLNKAKEYKQQELCHLIHIFNYISIFFRIFVIVDVKISSKANESKQKTLCHLIT